MAEKFNKEKEFEEVAEHIEAIKKWCVLNRVPMAMSFAIADDGKETTYKNEYISCATSKRVLADDKMEKYVKVYNGFNVIPEEIDTVEMI